MSTCLKCWAIKLFILVFISYHAFYYILLLAPFVSAISEYECSFVSGDGAGGTETKIGVQTGNDCIKACVELRKKDKSINGVTVRQDNSGGCWCEKSMDEVSTSSTYKTCFLKTEGKENCRLYFYFVVKKYMIYLW